MAENESDVTHKFELVPTELENSQMRFRIELLKVNFGHTLIRYAHFDFIIVYFPST